VPPPLSPEELEEFQSDEPSNRYARRTRIGGGRKLIGSPTNIVETVGLGNLKVITTNGATNA
jgi:hypothetical protein